MSYTDAEMLMATQVAYLNIDSGRNVGQVVDDILRNYGTYDQNTGTYTIKQGVEGLAKSQFETAQYMIDFSNKNNTLSWRHWSVVDVQNNNNGSGFYGCLIDAGDGNAIVGCRGSESYDAEAVVKDWIVADVGRMNNELTSQQADATRYMEKLYQQYGDKYDQFSFTGHSLGGSLATHAAVTAPEGMQNKIDKVISYDGPGFSDEYLNKHGDLINKIKDKLYHYEYSWVGNLLIQPNGIHNRVIKAHDDTEAEGVIDPQLWRHHTRNIEFDENGYVMDGERGVLQDTVGPITRYFENSSLLFQFVFRKQFVILIFDAFIFSVIDQAVHKLDQIIAAIDKNVNSLFNDFISFIVSGDYEVRTREISAMADDLDSVQRRMNQIADQVDGIKRSLPYDSISAYYFKNCLWCTSNAIISEGKRAGRLAKVIDRAAGKYSSGDQKVAGLF